MGSSLTCWASVPDANLAHTPTQHISQAGTRLAGPSRGHIVTHNDPGGNLLKRSHLEPTAAEGESRTHANDTRLGDVPPSNHLSGEHVQADDGGSTAPPASRTMSCSPASPTRPEWQSPLGPERGAQAQLECREDHERPLRIIERPVAAVLDEKLPSLRRPVQEGAPEGTRRHRRNEADADRPQNPPRGPGRLGAAPGSPDHCVDQRVAIPVGNEDALLAMSWRTIAPTSSMSMSTSGFSVKGPGLSSGSGSIEITAW